MERLTERNEYGVYYPYCDSAKGCGGQCASCEFERKIAEKLADYEDAEEEGLLLRLPCPVGTTVYCIEDECEDIYIEGSDYRFVGEEIFDTWMLDQFGKTVFLTEEEAEQALKRMESE